MAGICLAQADTGTISAQVQAHQAMGSTAIGSGAHKTYRARRTKDYRRNRHDLFWQRIRHTRCSMSAIEKECAFS